jgi:catechol 2,3-dioxygenase-like lactoylglutathione lyase family enzyme
MFRRSSHISVQVPADRFEQAVDYYQTTFHLRLGKREPGSAELRGDNFTIWVDVGSPDAVQEFVVKDGAAARRLLEAGGATILDETSCGFHVRDPFGLRYHVYVEDESTPPVD